MFSKGEGGRIDSCVPTDNNFVRKRNEYFGVVAAAVFRIKWFDNFPTANRFGLKIDVLLVLAVSGSFHIWGGGGQLCY